MEPINDNTKSIYDDLEEKESCIIAYKELINVKQKQIEELNKKIILQNNFQDRYKNYIQVDASTNTESTNTESTNKKVKSSY
jgi:hypothetical protein